jgi:hypothetical protein
VHSLIHIDHARAAAEERVRRARHVRRVQHPPSPVVRRRAARALVRMAVRLDREVVSA